LGDISNPEEYIARSISTTSKALSYIVKRGLKIDRLIYTSSSSVYGNNMFCRESDTLQPLSLHSSLKIANERLVSNFCREVGIDYTITRIFNMYGGDDNFSIVSKIIDSYRGGDRLTIFNNGSAIRDFIHIDDVVYIYNRLLSLRNRAKVLNIGLGVGISVADILKFLEEHIYI